MGSNVAVDRSNVAVDSTVSMTSTVTIPTLATILHSAPLKKPTCECAVSDQCGSVMLWLCLLNARTCEKPSPN